MNILTTIINLFRPARMFSKPLPLVIGAGFNGANALQAVLTGGKAQADYARQANARRDVKRLLDGELRETEPHGLN